MQWLWIVNKFVWYSLLPRALYCAGVSPPSVTLWCVTRGSRDMASHPPLLHHQSQYCPIISLTTGMSRPGYRDVIMSRTLRSHSQQVSHQSSLSFFPLTAGTAVSAMPCNQIGTKIVKCAFWSQSQSWCAPCIHSWQPYNHNLPSLLLSNNSWLAIHQFHYCQEVHINAIHQKVHKKEHNYFLNVLRRFERFLVLR